MAIPKQDQHDEALEKLEAATRRLNRVLVLVRHTKRTSKFYPIIRIMCKLELIKNWKIS